MPKSSLMKNRPLCHFCNRAFPSSSPHYYCCDPNENVCIFCHDKVCPRCFHERTRKHELVYCMRCDMESVDNLAFFLMDENKWVCFKCAESVYENGWSESQWLWFERSYDGHQICCSRDQVEKFLRDFCSRCKRKLVLEEQKQYENQVAIEILCNKCEKISKGEEKKTELKIQSQRVFKTAQITSEEKRHKTQPILQPDSTSKPQSKVRCDACGLLVSGKQSMITDEIKICEMCIKLSKYEEDKLRNRGSSDEWEAMQDDFEVDRMQQMMRNDEIIGDKLAMYNFSPPSLKDLSGTEPQEVKELEIVSEDKSDESMNVGDKLSTVQNTEESSLLQTHSLRRANSFELWESCPLSMELANQVVQCRECRYELVRAYGFRWKEGIICRQCLCMKMEEAPFPSESSIDTSPQVHSTSKKCILCCKHEGTNKYLGGNICSYCKFKNNDSIQHVF